MRIKVYRGHRNMRKHEEPEVFEVCHIFNIEDKEVPVCLCKEHESVNPDKLRIALFKFGPAVWNCIGECNVCNMIKINKKNKNKIVIGLCNGC